MRRAFLLYACVSPTLGWSPAPQDRALPARSRGVLPGSDVPFGVAGFAAAAPTAPAGSSIPITLDVRDAFRGVVLVDGRALPGEVEAPVGIRTIDVPRTSGFVSIEGTVGDRTKIVIVIGRTDSGTPVKPTIVAAAPRGSIEVTSNPDQAAIFLDARDTGRKTPGTLKDNAGSHVLVLKKSGYKDWERKLELKADDSARIHAELQKE